MKFGLISDIHANWEALSAVMADIEKRQIDKVHCLGDVIGYGSDPKACLEEVLKSCDIKLLGNHEYAALGLGNTERYNNAAKESTEWTKEQLGDYELSIINEFKMTEVINEKFRLVHASPFEPEKWHYIVTPEHAQLGFENFDENFCFFGHSHLPQIYIEQLGATPRLQVGHDFLPSDDNRYLINIGSVGQPRDKDPRACYVIVDAFSDEIEIQFIRVEYDIKKAQEKMAAAKLPEMLINRLSIGK